MKTIMYEGKEIQVEDCTPKWIDVLPIYVGCITNPDASTAALSGAVEDLKRMANLADRYNELLQAGFNPDEFLGNK